MLNDLKAPFPWFGGKSLCAAEVWAALCDVDNYVEPFAGSLAVLLARPETHTGTTETVNDLDQYLVNFWRALQHDPQAVAHYANNPVNEADLTARHIWMVNTGRERIERLCGDPDYYDAQVAGWWAWGICCWIGSGWCSGNGPWTAVDGRLVNTKAAGRGVNRQLVHLGNAGHGVNTGEAEILAYLSELAERLRYVRVCCGDWQRVVTNGALAHGSTVGVFLDPPYDTEIRMGELYNYEGDVGDVQLSAQVREWCIAHQDNPRYRIVLAGYEGEHDLPGWDKVSWNARAAYKTHKGDTNGNRKLERLWLSPQCQQAPASVQLGLFE